MDMAYEKNYIRLCGKIAARPEFSHNGRGERYHVFPLEVRRLSGNTDTVNVLVRESQLKLLNVPEGMKLCVTGHLRTYNNRRGDGAKLVITVLAKELYYCGTEDENTVILCGALCKEPNLRTTPMGRDICDLMLAVGRGYARSDYLPCICWGAKAREAACWGVGTQVKLEGRIQSRRYIKLIDGEPVEKTAFEVSAVDVTAAVPVWAEEGMF